MAVPASSTTSPWEGARLGGEIDRSFLWRRLHSLSGVLPVGFFLLFHIFENLRALGGAEVYDEAVFELSQMIPGVYFYAVEIGGILLPIAFHGIYGAYLSLEGRYNVGRYAYRRNILYLLQRLSGVLALFFIGYHVFSLRIQVTAMGLGQLAQRPGYVSYADVAAHYSNDWVLAFYVLGTLATAFHFGNGINGFCWTWGIAVGERSRRIVELVSWGVVLATAIPMLHILWAFRQ